MGVINQLITGGHHPVPNIMEIVKKKGLFNSIQVFCMTRSTPQRNISDPKTGLVKKQKSNPNTRAILFMLG